MRGEKQAGLIFAILFILATAEGMSALSATSTQCVYLTINLIGRGSLTVAMLSPPPDGNLTVLDITHSLMLKVQSPSLVTVKSNESFWLGKGTLVTRLFEQVVLKNTTWNVYLNISNISYSPSDYKIISIELTHIESVNVSVANQTTIFTTIQLNKSESFLIPKSANQLIFVSLQDFSVSGEDAVFGHIGYYLPVNINTSRFVVDRLGSQSATQTTSNLTITSNNQTIADISTSASTSLITTTATRSNPEVYYYIVAVVVIVLVVFIVLSKIRK